MKKLAVLMIGLALTHSVFAKEECEPNVDLADSLDFEALHIDCADDPVSIYDPESVGGFLSGKKRAVTVYEETKSAPVMRSADDPKIQTMSVFDMTDTITSTPVKSKTDIERDIASQDNAGVVFNIREPFTITGGPQSAINGLFVQMAQYCPVGWAKLKEWAEPAQAGYYLHYQFQCAKK
jgi:hypothetical protein